METTSKAKADEIIAWLREYAATRINSKLIDERRCVPPNIVLDFGTRGLFGLRVEERYGGLGLSNCDATRVLQQLGAIDLTLATLISSHAIGVYTIQKYGCEAAREEFLPKLASGRELSAFAMTESGAGSNPLAMKTQATGNARDGWTLNGEKYMVDSGSWGSVVTLFARMPGNSETTANLSAFAVRYGTPGLEIGGELLTMGLRGMVQTPLRLNNVRVGPENMLGPEGAGIAIGQDTLGIGRLNVAAKSLGGIKRCLQLLQRYASRRPLATGMLSDNPVTQSKTVQLACALSVIEALVTQTCEAMDRGAHVPMEAFLTSKVAASEYLWKAADTLLQVMGGRGFLETNLAPQILRDARSFSLTEGPTETLLMYLGSLALNTGNELERFLREELNAAKVADRLQETAERIRQRCSKGPVCETLGETNASYWMSWLAGDVAMWALLLAAAENNPDQGHEFAKAWARLKFEERISVVLKGDAAEWALSHHKAADDLIAVCAESIGDVEQTLPDAIKDLEPLLRKETPAAVAPSQSSRRENRTPEQNTSTFKTKWSEEIAASISALASREGVANHTVLLATLGALIHRHTGQAEVRTRLIDETEGHLDIHLDFDGRPALPDVLAQMTPGTNSRNGANGQGVDVELTLGSSPAFKNEDSPALAVTVRGETIGDIELRYDGVSFGRVLASDLTARLECLLKSWLADPQKSAPQLAMLPPGKRDLTLFGWNTTALPYPRDFCVHQLFEEQVKRVPDRPAIICDGQTLTYAELDARAETLARRLRGMGVTREVVVGVCVERSLDLPVSLLAIWKAGGAYIPLDITAPPQRLAHMLEETGVQVIVAQPHLVAKLPPHRAQIIAPDASLGAVESGRQEPTAQPPSSEQCAYILYTSGSTGKPKGVEVCHRSVVNFLSAMRQSPGFSEHDILVAVTPISFDIAGLELFLPLVTGGRVVLAGSGTAIDGFKLARVLEEAEATVLQATPATWQILIDSGWQGAPGLKALCGGDSLPSKLADNIRARTASLWNMYGPTETTIWSCVDEVRANQGPIAIGRPIANTQVYLLDENLEPVPVGVAGEIFIAGDGVARGYRKRPDLTAAQFLADPFSPGQSMYRTGDMGRYLSDGRIEHLGRLDHQVKVRGFRIELGEIETVLTSHEDVREAAVIARTYATDDVRLIAYLTLSPTALVGPEWLSKIQNHIREHLPSYMVPSAFVALEQLPLTPHGKVDRRALRETQSEDFIAKGPAEPAATPIEGKIMAIWSSLLRVPAIGRRDNFFALGGHSLLATQVVSRLRVEFGVEIPVALIFEQPTVAAQAEAVTKAREAKPQGTNGSSELANLDADSVARILSDLESLSEEEAQQRLAREA